MLLTIAASRPCGLLLGLRLAAPYLPRVIATDEKRPICMGCTEKYGKLSIYHKKTRRVKGGLIHSLWIGTWYSGLSTGQTALHRFGTGFSGLDSALGFQGWFRLRAFRFGSSVWTLGLDTPLGNDCFADTKMRRPKSLAQHLPIEFNHLIGKLRSG